MISDAFSIQIVDSPESAPKYDGAKVTMLKIQQVIVVGKGTGLGNPSVDIQLVDVDGQEYLVMATGGIIESLGAVVAGKRKRDIGQ